MKNKLLYISNSIIPSQYANSVHVMKMSQALQQNDFEVELVCYTQNKNFDNDEIFSKYGIDTKFKLKPFYIKSLRAKFFQKIFSILLLLLNYDKKSLVYGRDVYGVYLASLLGFEVIYESHGLPTTKLYSFIEKLVLKSKKLKKFVVISDKLKEIYLDSGLVKDEKKILVLHDGADEIDLSKKGVELGDGFHIGYVGSLYYEGRGVDIILEVAKLNLDFTFHLIGGKDEEVKYWKTIATDNVKFYGFLPHSEASKYLLSFDVVLMPYQKDLKLADNKVNTSSWMSPMKMFEYMAAKKAIVSSDLPVIREVLNEDNSILVEHDNIQDWSEAVSGLFEDSNQKDTLSKMAYEDFSKHYSWKQRAIKLIRKI
uniref:glycosyltransferase n=1 Tax=Aliarcobacter sp. TaxID=2321116 RepID=UPI004047ACA1